jgi:DNA-binding response OmpR family regulator
MLVGRSEAQSQRLAVVGFDREYPAEEILAALVRNQFHTVERPCDSSLPEVVARVEPDVVVLAIEPAHLAGRAIVSRVAASADCAIVVLGPGHQPCGFRESLEAGADACISEDSGPDQLLAQLEALLRRARRRSTDATEEGEELKVGALHIDFRRRAVRFQGVHIPMSPMEFKILALFARNVGRVLSPVEIVAAVHEYPYSAQQARDTVKVYVRRLRQKFAAVHGGPRYIMNARGFGYMLEPGAIAGPDAPGEPGSPN